MPSSRLPLDAEFPVDVAQLARTIPTAMARCRFRDWTIGDSSATATRVLDSPGSVLVKRENLQLIVEWLAVSPSVTRAWWGVFDVSQGQAGSHRDSVAQQFGEALRFSVYPSPELAPPPHNPVVEPGRDFDGRFTGILRDYSFCTPESSLDDLRTGVLPLGIPTFADGRQYEPGELVYLGAGRNEQPLIYKGALICAPQNSGKTELIVQWARAANAAGYNVLLIDVKGNLREKLDPSRWNGRLLSFSTNPSESDPSGRINFLSGFLDDDAGISREATDRIRQLAAALLPSEGWTGKGGQQEFHHRNSAIWLTAFIHLLLLHQLYHPFRFRDCRMVTDECREHWNDASAACEQLMCERTADLSDLYRLVTDEVYLEAVIGALRTAEADMREENSPVPECGADYWVREIALLLNPTRVPGGQRAQSQTFQEYTVLLKQALEPFAPHGTLCRRICDNGSGDLFRLEDLGAEPPEEPVTILIAARAQDQANADTVLSLVITRLQHLLFDRMPAKEPRSILLLLDETRRIRGFKANEYITFAREAKAGCVLVYQSLDQIGDEPRIFEILENVGTQIYLDSLTGNTARHFLKILPQRPRMLVTENRQETHTGVTRILSTSKELADAFSLNDLYRLPAGEWPALVYLSEPPTRRAFLVDMDRERLPLWVPPDPNSVSADLIATFAAPARQLSLSADGLLAAELPHGQVVIASASGAAEPVPQLHTAAAGSYSPDGKFLALGLADGRIQLSSGQQSRILDIHIESVTRLTWSPDSGVVASIANDGTLAVSEAASGRLIHLLHGDFRALAVFSTGPYWIAAVDQQSLLQVWPSTSGSSVWQFQCESPVHFLLASPYEAGIVWIDGSVLRTYRSGDADSLAPVRFAFPVKALAFHPSGRWLAASLENGDIWLLDPVTWEEPQQILSPQGVTTALVFANEPDAGSLYAAAEDGTVLRIDLRRYLA